MYPNIIHVSECACCVRSVCVCHTCMCIKGTLWPNEDLVTQMGPCVPKWAANIALCCLHIVAIRKDLSLTKHTTNDLCLFHLLITTVWPLLGHMASFRTLVLNQNALIASVVSYMYPNIVASVVSYMYPNIVQVSEYSNCVCSVIQVSEYHTNIRMHQLLPQCHTLCILIITCVIHVWPDGRNWCILIPVWHYRRNECILILVWYLDTSCTALQTQFMYSDQRTSSFYGPVGASLSLTDPLLV